MTDIFIDNNVFDFLFDKDIDICKEFPKENYNLYITKEVKFETEPIPNKEKSAFIDNLLNKCITIKPFFGFSNPNHTADKQRAGGFGEGYFSTAENELFRKELNQQFPNQKKNSKHDLYTNEADIDLAVRSIDSIVLSFDDKQGKGKSKGPLNIAFEKGYKVVFLRGLKDFRNTLNLHDYVIGDLNSRGLL
jgi:hypothetical protein